MPKWAFVPRDPAGVAWRHRSFPVMFSAATAEPVAIPASAMRPTEIAMDLMARGNRPAFARPPADPTACRAPPQTEFQPGPPGRVRTPALRAPSRSLRSLHVPSRRPVPFFKILPRLAAPRGPCAPVRRLVLRFADDFLALRRSGALDRDRLTFGRNRIRRNCIRERCGLRQAAPLNPRRLRLDALLRRTAIPAAP